MDDTGSPSANSRRPAFHVQEAQAAALAAHPTAAVPKLGAALAAAVEVLAALVLRMPHWEELGAQV